MRHTTSIPRQRWTTRPQMPQMPSPAPPQHHLPMMKMKALVISLPSHPTHSHQSPQKVQLVSKSNCLSFFWQKSWLKTFFSITRIASGCPTSRGNFTNARKRSKELPCFLRSWKQYPWDCSREFTSFPFISHFWESKESWSNGKTHQSCCRKFWRKGFKPIST